LRTPRARGDRGFLIDADVPDGRVGPGGDGAAELTILG